MVGDKQEANTPETRNHAVISNNSTHTEGGSILARDNRTRDSREL